MDKPRNSGHGQNGITWPQMFRDVLIASMNKGQLPLIIVLFVVILTVWKMPSEDVSKLVFFTVDQLINGMLFGYFLFSATLIGWFFHARWQRKRLTSEIERVSMERTKIQEQNLGNQVKSSRRRP